MYKERLEFLENVIILAKKHKVDVIKVDNVEILITRHESEETREDPNANPITDKPLTEEQLLFYSSDEEDV